MSEKNRFIFTNVFFFQFFWRKKGNEKREGKIFLFRLVQITQIVPHIERKNLDKEIDCFVISSTPASRLTKTILQFFLLRFGLRHTVYQTRI